MGTGLAKATAQQVALQIQTILAPNVALSAAVKAHPYAPQVAQLWPSLARDVLKKVGVGGRGGGDGWQGEAAGWRKNGRGGNRMREGMNTIGREGQEVSQKGCR